MGGQTSSFLHTPKHNFGQYNYATRSSDYTFNLDNSIILSSGRVQKQVVSDYFLWNNTSNKQTLILMATSVARLMFSVNTLPARPYMELLANVTASFAVLKGRTTRTGPNICNKQSPNVS